MTFWTTFDIILIIRMLQNTKAMLSELPAKEAE